MTKEGLARSLPTHGKTDPIHRIYPRDTKFAQFHQNSLSNLVMAKEYVESVLKKRNLQA